MKPREFWLDYSPISVAKIVIRVPPGQAAYPSSDIHVIEKSAYDALAAKLDIAKRAIEEAGCQDPTHKTVLNGGRFGDDVDVEAPCGECSVCLALKEIE